MTPAILLACLALAAPPATERPPGSTVGQAAASPASADEPSSDGAASEVLSLGLEEALQRALVANSAVGQARAEVGVANAQKRGALSAVLPRLQATGGLIRNSEEAAFGAPPNQRVILPLNDWNLRLLVSQPIFAGMREIRAYDQAKEGVRAAEQGVRATEDRILLKVAAEYITVVGGDALIEVGRQTVALARERLRQARDFFDAGESTRVDVVRAESAVAAAERGIALARRERGVAAGQLRVDLDVEGDIAVAEPRLELPARPSEALLIQRAEDTRADLKLARSALRISELEVSRQKGAYLPTVTADAGYVWQKTTFPSDRYGYAAVRMTVPIWTSGEIGARITLARERERQARLAYEEALRTVREDVRRALLNLETAETSLQLSQEQLQAAEAEYEQVSDLYRSQEATSLAALIQRPSGDCNAADRFLEAEEIYRHGELQKPAEDRKALPVDHPAMRLVLEGLECRRCEFPYSVDLTIPPTDHPIPMSALYWAASASLVERGQALREGGHDDRSREEYERALQLGLLLHEDEGMTFIQQLIALHVLSQAAEGLGDLAIARGDEETAATCARFLARAQAYRDDMKALVGGALAYPPLLRDPASRAAQVRMVAPLFDATANKAIQLELLIYLGFARALVSDQAAREAATATLERARRSPDSRIRKLADWGLGLDPEEARRLLGDVLSWPGALE